MSVKTIAALFLLVGSTWGASTCVVLLRAFGRLS